MAGSVERGREGGVGVNERDALPTIPENVALETFSPKVPLPSQFDLRRRRRAQVHEGDVRAQMVFRSRSGTQIRAKNAHLRTSVSRACVTADRGCNRGEGLFEVSNSGRSVNEFGTLR